MIDEYFEKPYWVVDILPYQVPENGGGRFFAVEKHYLRSDNYMSLRGKFADILLKIYCYYDICVYVGEEEEGQPDPGPGLLATYVKSNDKDLCVLVGDDEALITVSIDDTYLTVYDPSENVLRLVQALAASEGLFVRGPQASSDQ